MASHDASDGASRPVWPSLDVPDYLDDGSTNRVVVLGVTQLASSSPNRSSVTRMTGLQSMSRWLE
jgi:hypothetical protein